MLLAHQGGWDELLMVLVPMAVVVLLLRVASRRAQAAGDAVAPADEPAAEATDQPAGDH